jgi:hypothetical protein
MNEKNGQKNVTSKLWTNNFHMDENLKKIKIIMWQVWIGIELVYYIRDFEKKQEKRRFRLDPCNAKLGP